MTENKNGSQWTHSRGGLTNLQYALEHPKLVDSLISMGTPYFGTNTGSLLRATKELQHEEAPALNSILDTSIQKAYNDTWNNNYDLYSDINAIAIGGYSDTYFLDKVLAQIGSDSDSEFLAGLGIPLLHSAINGFGFSFPVPGMDETSLTNFINSSQFDGGLGETIVFNPSFYDDICVHLPSQLAMDAPYQGAPVSRSYRGFKTFSKKFTLFNSNLAKRATKSPAVVHNLEPYDAFLIQYVVANIRMGSSGDSYSTYELSDGSVGISGYFAANKEITTLTLPSVINGKTVTEIKKSAFENNFNGCNIKTLTIPSTIKSIGSGAFYGCDKLEIVRLSGTEVISSGAFKGCTALRDISLPASLSYLGENAFGDCKSLRGYFSLPNAVRNIEPTAFSGCSGISSFKLENPAETSKYFTNEGVIYERTSPGRAKVIKYPENKNASEFCPNSVVGYTVDEIAEEAFFGNSFLNKIDLFGIKKIDKRAFIGSNNLNYIVNGNTVEHIGTAAFDGTSWLAGKNSPGLNMLGRVLLKFVNDGRTVLDLTNLTGNANYDIVGIYSGAVRENKTLKKFVSGGVTYIGDSAFWGSDSIKSVEIGDKVTFIGKSAFFGCTNLEDVTINALFPPTMEENAFYQNSINRQFYVPYISKSYYSEAYLWENFSSLITSKKSNITFNSDGGTYATGINNVSYYSFLPEMPKISKEGYHFIGWFFEDTVTGKIFGPYAQGSFWDRQSNATLTARYQEIDYAITYHLEPDVFLNDNPISYNLTSDFDFQSPMRKGCSFVGWYDNPEFSGEAITAIKSGRMGDLDLYPRWDYNAYKITYNLNDSAENLANLATLSSSAYMNQSFKLDVPVRQGFEFLGWFDINGNQYTDNEGISVKKWDVANDTTLKAHWLIKQFFIKLNTDGKIQWMGANGLSANPTSVPYGTSFRNMVELVTELRNGPTIKTGYVFQYFTDEHNQVLDFTNFGSVPDYGPNGTTVTMTASWRLKKHTIYFDTAGSSTVCSPISNADYNSSIKLPNPEKTGYIFIGWFVSYAIEGFPKDSYFNYTKMPDFTTSTQESGSIQLVAKWTPKTMTVTYNSDGGSYIAPITATYDMLVNMAVPQKLGYSFLGWSFGNTFLTDENGTAKTKWMLEEATIVTAKWQIITYTLTYNLSGGSMTNSITHYTVVDSFVLPKPYKVGYRFAGWRDNATGKSVDSVAINSTGNKAYTAQWSGVSTAYNSSSSLYAYDSIMIADFSNNTYRTSTIYFYISSTVNELTFYSTSLNTFTNFSIIIQTRSAPLMIRFWNMDITSSNTYVVNGSNMTGSYILTIDIFGNNKITSSKTGGVAVYAPGTLNFTSEYRHANTESALTITGGNGSSYTTSTSVGGAGSSGSAGGHAVMCNTLTVTNVFQLKCIGGNGGNGGGGAVGSTPSIDSPSNGGRGGNGGNGGIGGNGINASLVYIYSGSVQSVGGKGGSGGSGGKGGNGSAGYDGIPSRPFTPAENGGDGYHGGNGGNGGNAARGGYMVSGSIVTGSFSSGSVNGNNGSYGYGGAGGLGGRGGYGGAGDWFFAPGKDGNAGARGSYGNDGAYV